MMHALNELASQISNGTEKTVKAMNHFLDYCTTHPNAILKFHASNMKLWIHTDASYLCQPKSHSRYGGFHFMGSKGDTTKPNGPIQVIAKILQKRNVVSSRSQTQRTIQQYKRRSRRTNHTGRNGRQTRTNTSY